MSPLSMLRGGYSLDRPVPSCEGRGGVGAAGGKGCVWGGGAEGPRASVLPAQFCWEPTTAPGGGGGGGYEEGLREREGGGKGEACMEDARPCVPVRQSAASRRGLPGTVAAARRPLQLRALQTRGRSPAPLGLPGGVPRARLALTNSSRGARPNHRPQSLSVQTDTQPGL